MLFFRESSLPLYLTQCKQTLFLLDHPSSDSHLSLVHPELVSGLKSHLRGTYTELDQWSTDLEDAWRVTENRLTVLIQFYRHKERAKEVCILTMHVILHASILSCYFMSYKGICTDKQNDKGKLKRRKHRSPGGLI